MLKLMGKKKSYNLTLKTFLFNIQNIDVKKLKSILTVLEKFLLLFYTLIDGLDIKCFSLFFSEENVRF